MAVRKFFLISLVTAVLAVGLHVSGLKQYSAGLRIRAMAASAGEAARTQARTEAHAQVRIGDRLIGAGYIAAIASVACFIQSARRREPARRSIVFIVLFFYLFFQFMLV